MLEEDEAMKSSSSCNDAAKEQPNFKQGDLVWAKLGTYPWWPSMVCNHPTAKTCRKGGKKPMVHVQFFDYPPSRAWVQAKFVATYTGSQSAEFQPGGRFYHSNPDLKLLAHQADHVMGMPIHERLQLVVCRKQST